MSRASALPRPFLLGCVLVVTAACGSAFEDEASGGEDLAMGMGDLFERTGSDGLDLDAPSDAEQAVHRVCGSGPTVKGIDVSKWQGPINWAAVARDGVKYAFIRVSDGTGYLDNQFNANWRGARANGVKRGVYQFFRSNQDPIAQADLLIRHMGTLQPGDLPPVVDVESTDNTSNAVRARKLHQWLDRVEAATGVRPIIYTGGYFWDDHVAADFSSYRLWHAGYTGGTCPTTLSRFWSRWSFWQYTSSGSVSGISGRVDMNRFNGTLDQLTAIGLNPCVPHAEQCNGVDDNCNGQTDEGGVCAPRDEAMFGAISFDASTHSDLDGDGVADVCVRAAAGVTCARSAGGAPLSTTFSTTSFADANGWDDLTNATTLRLGDINGDGRADICARANANVVCKPMEAEGFGANITGPALSDASGWNKPEYFSTFRLADVDGDGSDDVCARGAAGFRCHLSTGTGFGDAIVGAFFRDADGFTDPSHYGTIRMPDIDGDHHADVCARTTSGIECHRFVDGAWGDAIVGPAWSNDAGANALSVWSTLRFADLDGDHKDDVCLRTVDGVRCHLSTGDEFLPDEIVGPELSDAHGWGDVDNYATLRFGDVNGDGRADLCARANAGARCWMFRIDRTFSASVDGTALFGDSAGFTAAAQFRTFRVADVDGDARADLCARGTDGLSCVLSTGTGFGDVVQGPRWSTAAGFGAMTYSGTLMVSGYLPCRAMPETCDGVDNDCNGIVDDGDTCSEEFGTDVDVDPSDAEDPTREPVAAHEDATVPADDTDETDVDAPLREIQVVGDCSSTPTMPLGALLALLALPHVTRRRRR